MGMSADFAVHTNNGKGEDPVSKLGVSFLLFIKIAKELKEREKELELQKAEA